LLLVSIIRRKLNMPVELKRINHTIIYFI
jgi:hypothetical protein